uniref:Protein deacetylase HDAC6 n=1 Tax=Astatotilapia calliptera TaxID=8154 RepID=A0A3P8PSC9_ASTCA
MQQERQRSRGIRYTICTAEYKYTCGINKVFVDLSLKYFVFSHPESPDRVTAIMKELERQDLLPLCIRVEVREATEEELLLAHMKHYVDLIKSTQTMTLAELQTLSNKYDSIYLHPESFQVSVTAVGAVLQLVDRVMTSELKNGFAIIRPPGHHAQANECNGYSIFNNVAIAARYAQTRHAISRVLIVDWDVHHGQGIQYRFQEDPSVLYFSVHRYEQGSFWPHLPESDSHFVGSGPAEGRNINLPWNQTGMTDADYIAAFQQVLLPVAYEFQPQLVLVSAGFDAAVGDLKGEMCVSPQCFQVLTHMLMSLAEGRLVLALEGGYNYESSAESAAACIRALLGGPCPPLTTPTAPSDSALQSISQTISALYPHWASLQVLGNPQPHQHTHSVIIIMKRLEPNLAPSVATTTGLVYDERMMEHSNLWDRHHPEQPQRIFKIFSKHQQLGLVDRCQRIPVRLATEEELSLCHRYEHIEQMKATAMMKPRELHKLGDEFVSIYLNQQSFQCAQLAAGSCLNALDQILCGQVTNAVAIVRPPGHHAERDYPCGFCLFNTAALAARYAKKASHDPLMRILILDWDVHHGNGTQHMFEDDDSVLYISLHRYDNGAFFPSSEDAAPDKVGVAKGAGFNVNVAWSGGRMGDSDYLAAFHRVVMPIATEFNPSLVLVSAGFDAARGDPLGGYNVTPEGYAHLTHMLMSLAGGRVLVILEGGYNLSTISDSMAMCTSMLLGDPPPALVTPLPPPHHSAVATINEVIRYHVPYWRSLRIDVPESVRAALPTLKHRGKRSSKGKGRKSEQECSSFHLSNQTVSSLEQLTQGLASLDIGQTSANQNPASSPVGGARPKVPLSSEKPTCEEVKEESDDSTPACSESADSVDKVEAGAGAEPEPEGACGWSKPQTSLELMCGADADGSTLYVVDPLSWCPHLDAVKPLPSSGIDVFRPCQDCGSEAENWICLTCYQVFCGRYVNEHMVNHGVVSEHPLVLSFCDLSAWCYLCEAYVHNQILFEAKNAAHCGKFGEEIPPWS